jgi:hypothetical protein
MKVSCDCGREEEDGVRELDPTRGSTRTWTACSAYRHSGKRAQRHPQGPHHLIKPFAPPSRIVNNSWVCAQRLVWGFLDEIKILPSPTHTSEFMLYNPHDNVHKLCLWVHHIIWQMPTPAPVRPLSMTTDHQHDYY